MIMFKTVKVIMAFGENGEFSNKGLLPFKSPEEMAHFKRTTKGKRLMMGRNTYESLPGMLKDREVCYVVTSDEVLLRRVVEGFTFIDYEKARDVLKSEDIFIIGGYDFVTRHASYVDEWIISVVKSEFTEESDTKHDWKKDLPLGDLIYVESNDQFVIMKFDNNLSGD